MPEKKSNPMRNAVFAKENTGLKKAITSLRRVPGYENFKNSPRQASKWRRQMGAAWKHSRGLL